MTIVREQLFIPIASE